MAINFVKNFKFPRGFGFTGSADAADSAEMRGEGTPGSTLHPRAQASLEDRQLAEGKRLGFAHGGQVKMDSMDDGVQPAREGRNEAEKEAGGTKRMLPGYQKGGGVKGDSEKADTPRDNAERKILQDLKTRLGGQYTEAEGSKSLSEYRLKHRSARGLAGRSAREMEALGIKKGGKVKKYQKGGKAENGNGDSVEIEIEIPADGKKAVEAHEKAPKPRGHGQKKMGGAVKG